MRKRKNSQKKLAHITISELKHVTGWINQLTKEEMSQFEAVSRIQLAQVLLEAYLARKSDGIRGKAYKSTKKGSR